MSTADASPLITAPTLDTFKQILIAFVRTFLIAILRVVTAWRPSAVRVFVVIYIRIGPGFDD